MDFLSKTVLFQGDSAAAVRELRNKFSDFPVQTLFFFASHVFDDSIADLVQKAFPGVLTVGCSSYAEMGEGGIHTGSLTAIAFSPDTFEVAEAAVAEHITSSVDAVDQAFKRLEERIGRRMIDLDFHSHFGMTLFDGSSPNIEKVMERAGNLSDIIFVGGYASDDFSMRGIRQYLNGQVYRDSAVMSVFKPRGRFSLLKTQSAMPLGATVTVTKADPADRVILELDGEPAVEVYARSIGLEVEDLADDLFLIYPLGLMAQGEPFIRAGRRILDNGGLQLFCSVMEGQRLSLMRTEDIVLSTKKALAEKRHELGGIRALVDFDCAHRALTLQSDRLEESYAGLFTGMESAGFFTFGEAYIANVNQTSVMVLFGE